MSPPWDAVFALTVSVAGNRSFLLVPCCLEWNPVSVHSPLKKKPPTLWRWNPVSPRVQAVWFVGHVSWTMKGTDWNWLWGSNEGERTHWPGEGPGTHRSLGSGSLARKGQPQRQTPSAICSAPSNCDISDREWGKGQEGKSSWYVQISTWVSCGYPRTACREWGRLPLTCGLYRAFLLLLVPLGPIEK